MTVETKDSDWPIPKFSFIVDWGSITNIPFQEASVFEIELQDNDFQLGNGFVFSSLSKWGLAKNGTVTLKKGVIDKENNFLKWHSNSQINSNLRHDLFIKLMDEEGNSIMTWKFQNAWPTKFVYTNLKSDRSEVAIESIEIAHEGMIIENR